MKSITLLLSLLMMVVVAQAKAADPVACDVTYTVDTNAVDAQGVEHDVSLTVTTVNAVPWADVLDNSAKGLKVVNVMSKLQDKGGPYTIETGEVRTCDGGAPMRVAATSVMVKGVTLDGSNQIARMALVQADQIVARYEARHKHGDKMGWAHDKARKTKRNDLGQRVKE